MLLTAQDILFLISLKHTKLKSASWKQLGTELINEISDTFFTSEQYFGNLH